VRRTPVLLRLRRKGETAPPPVHQKQRPPALTSLIRNSAPLGPYTRPISRALRRSGGGAQFLRAFNDLPADVCAALLSCFVFDEKVRFGNICIFETTLLRFRNHSFSRGAYLKARRFVGHARKITPFRAFNDLPADVRTALLSCFVFDEKVPFSQKQNVKPRFFVWHVREITPIRGSCPRNHTVSRNHPIACLQRFPCGRVRCPPLVFRPRRKDSENS